MKMDEEEEDLHQRAFLFLNPESKLFLRNQDRNRSDLSVHFMSGFFEFLHALAGVLPGKSC